MKEGLQEYVKQGGCSCKLGPHLVQAIASQVGAMRGGNVLVGIEHSDDAGVYQIREDMAMIQTVDFFTPPVSEPYRFGRIAAANALSDIYAMGGTPLTALNLVAFPVSLVTSGVLAEVLRGGSDTLEEAQVVLLGGHSIEDEMPKYGLAVTGMGHPDKIWTNSGAKEGDRLILTKPLGTGILLLAKRGGLFLDGAEEAIEGMMTLNRKACEEAQKVTVHACTDVTGYSLMGHGSELARGSHKTLHINSWDLPLYKEVIEAAQMGLVPTAAYGNRKALDGIRFAATIPEVYQDICYDPQTSGGLLLAMPKESAAMFLERNKETAWPIGWVGPYEGYDILVE